MEPKRLQVPVIGLRRSGKSSILNVVYNELHPDDTVFLESTTKPSFILSDSFLPIRIIDTPSRVLLGDVRLEKGIPLSTATGARAGPPPPVPARNAPAPTQSLNGAAAAGTIGANIASGSVPGTIAANIPELLAWTDVSAVVFVIDSQDDYYEALSKLQTIILSAFAENQTIEFHVFVHKIDGYSNDYRQDTLSTIQGKVLDDLVDSSPSFIAQAWSYPEPPPAAKEAKSSSKKDRSRSKSKDLSFSRSPAATGGNSSSGGGGYDASASEFSSFSGGGYRSDVAPEPGLINLDQAVRLHCHATSIYDTSVFVAISKLQQSLAHKVKPEEPIDADMISNGAAAAQAGSTDAEGNGKPTRPAAATLRRNLSLAESMEQVCDSICSTCKFENAFLFDLPTRTYIGSDSAPFDAASFDLVFDYAGFLAKFAGLYAGVQSDSAAAAAASSQQHIASASSSAFQLSTSPSSARRFLLGRISKDKAATDASAATPAKSSAPAVQRWASSVTRLQPDRSLCFWQINHRLALIALMHSDVHAKQTGLIDYNITFFRRAVQGLYGLAQTST
ncbi:related to Ras-like G protein RagD [Sporisorium reilianum f. sp. reilianum]|uniref:Related to Ras-like G protein RagD n=1 Tax=Sporisorium reilianum f. sp. reilianum TaxID=72559 RepID=A0A2N8UEL1_9BASI|nr:related to Ras-like G protein RagD [Sporisorium reilianum f. sp. reilianum]